MNLPAVVLMLALAAPTASTAAQAPDAMANANAQVMAGCSHLAIHTLDQAVQAGPQAGELRTEARLLAATGHSALAAQRWRALLRLRPGDAEALGALSDAALGEELPVPGPKLQATPDPGLGLWVSGGGRPQLDAVNAYNLAAPLGQHVRYLFVRAGTWTLDGSRSHWTLDLAQARMAAQLLAGDAAVHLWLDGSVRGARRVDPGTWTRLAADLARALASDPRLAGVQLYPHEGGPGIYPLCAALRRVLTVPLSLAVPADQPEAFRYADFVVLRPQPQRGSVADQVGWVRDLAAPFLHSAAAQGAWGMVGLDAMEAPDVFTAGRAGLSQALPQGGAGFLGLAVWGLVADDEGRCADLAPGVWNAMQVPLEQP